MAPAPAFVLALALALALAPSPAHAASEPENVINLTGLKASGKKVTPVVVIPADPYAQPYSPFVPPEAQEENQPNNVYLRWRPQENKFGTVENRKSLEAERAAQARGLGSFPQFVQLGECVRCEYL
jgi:hypothetical protein